MRLLILFLFTSFILMLTAAKGYTQIEVIRDISYRLPGEIENDTLQRLNLILPGEVKHPPLLIWIGGGAWSYTDRNIEMDLAQQFARRGMAVASVGHRLSSALWRDTSLNMGYQHPDHIQDLAAAFHYLFDHADKYGYDPQKIFVGGFSSGAHLAFLLAVDSQYLAKYDLTKELIKGIIPIAGMYDVPHYHETLANSARPELAELHVEAVFGPKGAQHEQASPTRYLDQLSTPVLLISERDSYSYTRVLEDKMMSTDFRDIEILHIRELGHSALWKDLSFNPDSRYRELIVGFITSKS